MHILKQSIFIWFNAVKWVTWIWIYREKERVSERVSEPFLETKKSGMLWEYTNARSDQWQPLKVSRLYLQFYEPFHLLALKIGNYLQQMYPGTIRQFEF